MKYTDKQIEHIQYAFRAFCKKVLYHEVINAYRDLQRRQKHEISLDALCNIPAITDEYFSEQDMPVSFAVCEQTFIVGNEELATALLALPESRKLLKL